MVAKKSESDKYVRVAFTLEPELHSSVIEKVKAEKATLSGLISTLLYGWVSGALPQKGEMPTNDVESVSIQEVMSRIRALEETVSTLMITYDHQSASVHISPQVIDGPELTDRKFLINPIQHSLSHVEENTIRPGGENTDVIRPVDTEITNILQPVKDSYPETQKKKDFFTGVDLKPDEWYTQLQIRDKIDVKIPLNTRKGWVSKAVANGKLMTNGKKGKECRIKGSSAIEWINTLTQKPIVSE